MCTRAVSGLAHYFERAGIPTVVLALIPQHAEKIKPPRTLLLPFDLGRPLGVPNDAAFQHRVLTAALAMLSEVEGPVFKQYEEDAPMRDEATDEGWSCPVSFSKISSDDAIATQVLSEIGLLQPWFDKGKAQRHHTSFGVSELSLEDIVDFLASFLDEKMPDKGPGDLYDLADSLKYAAEDLKAFYNESATSQPGSITAREAENWYWGDTKAGAMMRRIKAVCVNHQDDRVKIVAGFTLVPQSQEILGSG